MTTLRSLGKHEEGNLLFILVLTEVTFWIFHPCRLLASVYTLSWFSSSQPPLQSFPLGSLAVCLSCTSSYLLHWTPTCGIFVSDSVPRTPDSSAHTSVPYHLHPEEYLPVTSNAVELISFQTLSPVSSSTEVFLRPIFSLVSLLY